MRLLGLRRRMPITQAVHHLSWWARRSLLLVMPTGLVLFMGAAAALETNLAFQVKLLLLPAAGVNVAIFQWVTFRGMEGWDGDGALPLRPRLAGGLSILLCFSVLASGRLIAYG